MVVGGLVWFPVFTLINKRRGHTMVNVFYVRGECEEKKSISLVNTQKVDPCHNNVTYIFYNFRDTHTNKTTYSNT